MSRCVVWPFGVPFIERFADLIMAGRSEVSDLSKTAVVFGGQRPHLFLGEALARRNGRPFLPPRAFDIDGFVAYVHAQSSGPARRIDDLDACHVIFRLAREHAPEIIRERSSFAAFLPWAREVLAFMEQLDLEAVPLKALEDIGLHAAIGFDVAPGVNTLLKEIGRLRVLFHEELEKTGSATRGSLYLNVAARIEAYPASEFDEIIFAGFFYLHRTERAIIKSLLERERARCVFQGDEREGVVLAEVGRAFGEPLIPDEPIGASPDIFCHAGIDLHAEVAALREVLPGLSGPGRTVVVLPDATSMVPVLSGMEPHEGPVNVSMGYPLKRTVLATLFEDIARAQETRREGMYYAPDYLGVLEHPLIKNLACFADAAVLRTIVHRVEEMLIGRRVSDMNGRSFVRLADVIADRGLWAGLFETEGIEEARRILGEWHDLLFGAWEEVATVAEFVERWGRLCRRLLKESPGFKHPLNMKALERVIEILESLDRVSFREERFEPEQLLGIMRELWRSETLAFSGDALEGLQVLGFMETRLLSFDNVLILDVNESILPRIKVHEPLIPRDVMVRLGIDRLEKEEEIQAYQFRRLIAGARSVHLFYRENEEVERSRFIEALIWEREEASGRLGALAIDRVHIPVHVRSEEVRIPKTQAHLEVLRALTFSATSVDTYLKCPVRFYHQYVLGLREADNLLDEPGAADIGRFIHELLEETFRPFVGARPKIDAKTIRRLLERCDEKFEEVFGRSMRPDAFLVREVLRVRLEHFMKAEAQREARAAGEIVGLEVPLEGVIRVADRDVRFRAKVDRIEKAGPDGVIILDYKTGGVDPMPRSSRSVAGALTRSALKETLRSVQLSLYARLVAEAQGVNVINAGLYSIREASVRWLFSERMGLEERRTARERCDRALEFLIAEIFDPRVDFIADMDDARACDACPFFGMCRP
jgi:ATP-dependent helicase/nuclease subunit B